MRISSQSSLVAILFTVSVSLSATSHAQDEKTPTLKYGWKAGERHVFTVKIQADRGDYWVNHTGRPSYSVTSADDDGIKFTFSGSVTQSTQSKPGKRVIIRRGFPRVGSSFSGGSQTLSIDRFGEVTSSKGSSQLPYLLGNLSMLTLEPLPQDGKKTWTLSEDITIGQSNSRFPRPSFLRRPGDTTTYKAKQETTYTVSKVDEKSVTIGKTYSLKSSVKINGKPKFEISGKGEFIFDREQGSPVSLDYEQKVFYREQGQETETPVTVTVRRLTDEELAAIAKAAEAARKKASEPLGAGELEKVVADLTSGNQGKYLGQILKLQRRTPDNPNKEVAAALAKLTESENGSVRYSAARALVNWATPESTTTLLKLLDDSNVPVRNSAMDALARLKVKKAIPQIAAKLDKGQDRYHASKTLLKFGPDVEDEVLKQLESSEWQTRNEACKILKQVGSEKSIPVLELRTSDSNALVKRTAGEAIQAIQKRGKAF